MTFPTPPESITVSGQDYAIDTDFRVSVEFELLAGDPDVSPEDAALGMLDLYFPQYSGRFLTVTSSDELELVHLATHIDEALNSLLSFYSGGMPETRGKTGGKAKQLYDFALDEPRIYASFLQAYGIDLRAAHLHWWNFKALFCALPQDTVFGNILHIRAMEISPKMSKEEKAEYRRLKRLYALPDKKSVQEQEEEDKLRAVLMGSGDLSELEG